MKEYTPYQQRIIKNYYRNRQGLALQKLQELVSELYLAETDKKRDQLWKRVAKALANLEIEPKLVEHILERRSAEVLAENIKDWWSKLPRE